ncbi:acyl-homoserine-lactone synthase [Methylocapsa sp. D3K7]|uniref:acyl-homoserine-lactone synthase n=1 Tax=Methylocapsa sp. D3K7 TaxID=3041435 RepID=UPI00244E9848|nr:acyl-homoserine-lactone synthase [Methylocapsa sp. D3K7]WGJ14621.1 acyl-homoserine-lactone synthase [Methylocapsa sp. D3K7]
MIHIVTAENEFQYRNELEQAYRLRYQVFVKEMGWSELDKPDGREIDQFDNKYAVHLLYIEKGKVLGYQRMLPSTRPHLLSEIMPQLCEVERPVGPHIWECTRHCVAPGHRERGRFAAPIANALLSGMVEWGLESGISTAIIEIDPILLLRLVQLHFRMLPLGLPQRIGTQDVVAVTATFDWRTLNRLRETRGDRKRVLTEKLQAPTLLHA